MGRVQTPLSGITTTSAYQDGNCHSLVNMRNKNGALHPVTPRKIKQQLSQEYDILFIHQNNNYKNWIGVINQYGYSTIYTKIFGGLTFNVTGAQNIKRGDLYQTPNGSTVKINNIYTGSNGSGNIETLFEYGEPNNGNPSTSGELTLIQGTGQQKITYSSFYNTGSSEITSIESEVSDIHQIGNTISLITEDSILYLLYKNDSYIVLGEIPSVPPVSFKTSDEMAMATRYFQSDYNTVTPANFIEATKGLVYKAMDMLVNGGTDKNGNTIVGLGPHLFDAHIIRYAFRLYDGSLVKHSPPILIMPVGDILKLKKIEYDFDATIRNDVSKVIVHGYRLYMFYDFNYDWDNWQDIIKSVDIFLSPALGISNIEKIREDMPTSDGSLLYYDLIKDIPTEAFDAIEKNSNFYLVKSIPLGEQVTAFNPVAFPSTNHDKSILENILHQEVMTLDDFSNHKYGAKYSYVYNNRLHIAGIKTTFFNGFNASYFHWNNKYNDVNFKTGIVRAIVCEVELQVGSNTEKVYSTYINYDSAPELFSSALISYPDPRAKSITIYEVQNDNTFRKRFYARLKPHGALNIAYYLNPTLKPIVGDINVAVSNPITNNPVTLFEPNKVKVSELSNPIVFPNKNTYLIGNGKILAMATNAIRISEGQFGQYPLYIFTTQGIYALNVGQGEVVYSNISAPVSYEIPTTPIICSTPFGVIFTSERGICIIRGQEVELLTANLQQPFQELKLQTNERLEDVLLNYNQRPFPEYLKGLELLAYNSIENELIICDRDSDFNYVLNFDSQSFYQSTERIDKVVKNTFPELLVIHENKVKDYSLSETNIAHVSLITRPLQFGTTDIKKLERMVLRGKLIGVDKLQDMFSYILNYYSNDNVNFPILLGIPVKPGNYIDFDMGLFARSKYRQFVFAFAGILDERSEIFYIDTEITKEYTNNKMR